MSENRRKLPETASVAIVQADGKLHAPSAARNVEPILQAMRPFVPEAGQALEIASGTGEHIMRYAAAFPALEWQPTDIEEARLASIDAWASEARLPNLRPARLLDATTANWAADWPEQTVILFSNLLHLISENEALTVLKNTANALHSGGVILIYGPFMRGAEFASAGDKRFHESLCGQDPEIGYKLFQWVQEVQAGAGLKAEPPIEMPANNLLLVARKP